jgi:hypothetical protein
MRDEMTEQTSEPTLEETPDAAAPTAAPMPEVTATSHVAPRASTRRWIVGLSLAGVAIAAGIGVVLVLGGRPTPEGLRYIPADAAMVAELRLDMPGDQLQHVGNLLAHFPGFKDQAILTDKVDEALQRFVSDATGGEVDYRTQLKPWVAGPTFVAVWLSPDMTSTFAGQPRGLISATTNGAVSCDAPFAGRAVSHETYRDLDLQVAALPTPLACVIDGRQALIGDPTSVKAGIDAHADGSGVDHSDRYRAARDALGGDRLATVFVSSGFFDSIQRLAGASLPTGPLSEVFPDWMIYGVRAEDDALVADFVSDTFPVPTGGPTFLPVPPAHPSTFAPLVPAGTIALYEGQGVGVGIQNALAALRADPRLAPSFGDIDTVLGSLGGADQLVGWVQDAGLVVLHEGTDVRGGVLLSAADEATATARLNQVVNLLRLAALGDSLKLRESTVEGTKVTTVVIEDVSALVPNGALFGETLPGGSATPAIPVEISMAAKGRVIMVGSGEAFIRSLVTVQAGQSLADQPVYKHALSRSLGDGGAFVYVGITTAISFAEQVLPAEVLGTWQADIKPYVEPIEAFMVSVSTDDATVRFRTVMTVKQP